MPSNEGSPERSEVQIDAAELEEARRDPAVHRLLAESQAEGERVFAEGRDHTGIHETPGGRPVVPLEVTIMINGVPFTKGR